MTRPIGTTTQTVVRIDTSAEGTPSTGERPHMHARTGRSQTDAAMAPFTSVLRGDYAPGAAATSPTTLQKQVVALVARAARVSIPAALQATTINLDAAFIEQVCARHAYLGLQP